MAKKRAVAVPPKLDPILTSESDGYGPVGSDNGADTLHRYQEWRKRHRKRETFLARFLRGWGLRDEGWDELDEARVAEQMEQDRFQRKVGDDVVIAFAFAQLIVEGDVAPADRQRALWAIARQEMPCVLESRGWSEPKLRLEALAKMRKALLAASLCRQSSGRA
jgi:uncharacterized protein YfeS